MRGPAVRLLPGLVLALGACGDERDPGTPVAPGARERLTELSSAELVRPARAESSAELTPPLGAGLEGWRVTTDSARPLEVTPGLLEPSIEVEEGESVLVLRGRRGGLYRVAPAEPGACYELVAEARARGIATDISPFDGAAPWLGEVAGEGTPEELFASGLAAPITRYHVFETALGADGWQERRLVFRAGPETRALAMALFLTLQGSVSAGSADFRRVALRRIPEPDLWEDLLRAASANTWRGERAPSDWRAERFLRATVGAEVRPSIVLLPGEKLRFTLRVPSGTPRFEAALALWSPALVPGEARELGFELRVDGEELLRERSSVPDDLTELRWRERSVDLARFAGRAIELEVAVEGGLPGLLGSPVVRDAATPPALPNVLLVSIDTLRADHVGCYGYDGGTTPNLDALARRGILFRRAVSNAPYTLPAHASLLSGQFPSVHRAERPSDMLSSQRSPLLAQALARAGLRTQAFTGGVFLNADFGFDKGFDAFDPIDPLRPRESSFFAELLARSNERDDRPHRPWEPPLAVTAELLDERGPDHVLDWLGEHAGEPFFLLLHTYVVHDYDPPADWLDCGERGCTSERVDYNEYRISRGMGWRARPISDADREHLVHRYDAALRYADDVLGRILARLEELGIDGRTIVVVTSDHGEELFERGFMQHGKTLYEELLKVPLILAGPGIAPRVVEEAVMTADVAPTILAALGLPLDPRMQGVDLLGQDLAGRGAWSEVHDDFVHKEAWLDPSGWKLIHAPPDTSVVFPAEREWSLFDLESDPGELAELSAAETARFGELRARLERQRGSLDELARELGAAQAGELSAETQAQLRQLGYVED
jgi:arylsulfatase A-like enzyme